MECLYIDYFSPFCVFYQFLIKPWRSEQLTALVSVRLSVCVFDPVGWILTKYGNRNLPSPK